MTLRDLVLEVTAADVTEAIGRLYDQAEKEWVGEAITHVLEQLRSLTPAAEGANCELHIEFTQPVPDEEPAWQVWASQDHDTERYSLSLSPWEEWLAACVSPSLHEAMPAAEIVAHCIWDMTFHGWTQEQIAEFRAELDRRAQEIDEGKAELVPWEEVKARLGATIEEARNKRELS